jgi:hypothetical protein
MSPGRRVFANAGSPQVPVVEYSLAAGLPSENLLPTGHPMPQKSEAPAAPSLSAEWTRWCRFTNQLSADPKANSHALLHARLTRFHPTHPCTPDHLDLILDLLFRAVPLLQAGVAWEQPSAGLRPGQSSSTASARGAQWRLVMSWAGFELLVKALLAAPRFVGVRQQDFAGIPAPCTLPAFTPIASPAISASVQERWFPTPTSSETHPALQFLGLKPRGTKTIADWLVHHQPIQTWAAGLSLAKSLRDATAHGALSASKVKEWKLQKPLERLLADLEAIAGAVLRVLNEGTPKEDENRKAPTGNRSVARPDAGGLTETCRIVKDTSAVGYSSQDRPGFSVGE